MKEPINSIGALSMPTVIPAAPSPTVSKRGSVSPNAERDEPNPERNDFPDIISIGPDPWDPPLTRVLVRPYIIR